MCLSVEATERVQDPGSWSAGPIERCTPSNRWRHRNGPGSKLWTPWAPRRRGSAPDASPRHLRACPDHCRPAKGPPPWCTHHPFSPYRGGEEGVLGRRASEAWMGRGGCDRGLGPVRDAPGPLDPWHTGPPHWQEPLDASGAHHSLRELGGSPPVAGWRPSPSGVASLVLPHVGLLKSARPPGRPSGRDVCTPLHTRPHTKESRGATR